MNNKFYKPEQVRELYGDIASAYQVAFAGDPWFEVSQCPDSQKRCVAGLSSVAVGTECMVCGLCPSEPAYEEVALIERFDAVASSRSVSWYVEQNGAGVALAGLAWQASAEKVATEKYDDVPEMQTWIANRFEKETFVWLDEVFANKALRASGNLRNFGEMCRGFAKRLDASTLAFRTINGRMLTAARRDFGASAEILLREVDVPDRREFVVIKEIR